MTTRKEYDREPIARCKLDRSALLRALAVAPAGLNGSSFCCPFHDDKTPSGSVFQDDDGHWRFKCHGKCRWSGDVFDVVMRVDGCDFAEACNRLGVQRHGSRSTRGSSLYPTLETAQKDLETRHGHCVGQWPYHRGDGTESFRVLRLERNGKKTYRPIHPTSDDWKEGDPRGKLPLYRLPELEGAGRVYILEGEKCVEQARLFVPSVTTSAHGANAASKTDWSPLAGRECVILPDNDEAGRRYADAVGWLLTNLDPPATVKIVDLPLLGPGEDRVRRRARSHGGSARLENDVHFVVG